MNNKEIWEKIKYAVYSWEIINLDNWKKYICWFSTHDNVWRRKE